ncbi:hypothetical protein C8F04DRAFT_1069227 [Mycena alexandri]|uniref:DUF6534 domain-containing protein n=1 Tax=Mycena alexandri TaxID=1745969 RepID=A0AAD6TEG4_9AGAR|nr:hypothetical protein C8F04DRAFT_1069227 [Mycena alexandri]
MSNISKAPVRVSNQPLDYEYEVPGPILLDGLLHSFCLGFVLALGLKYWEEYVEDSIRKRVFVLTIVLLSFLQTVLEDYKLWTVAIFRRSWVGSPFMWTDFFLNGIICAMCEAFYIRRCWKMTGKSRRVLYPMSLLWISVVGAEFYITITVALEFKHFTVGQVLDTQVEKLFRSTVVVFSYWVIGCTILDMTVAVILITFLLKSKTGLEASNSVVHRVILLTLETTLLPSVAMVAAVIVLHVTSDPGKHDDLVMFFVFSTAKLYAIGLLRTLNARAKFRERIDSTDLGRTSLATWSWDQDQQMQERAGRTSKETAPTSGGSVESPSLTFASQVRRTENIAPDDVSGGPSTGSQHVHFGSPILDQYERGYARLRVSSIHRPKPNL